MLKWLVSITVICYNILVPIYKKVDKEFFKKWGEDMAYVLGFFAADGCITVNKRGGQFWCIQITDKDLLHQIRDVIGSEHKISCRKGKGKIKDLFRLQIGSIEMCNDLRNLGFSERKTNSMVVPNVPDIYLPYFIRGYFDGDGHVWVGLVHKERGKGLLAIQAVFTSCSSEFLEVIKRKLERVGLCPGRVRKGNGNYYRLMYSIHSALKLYTFMYNSLGTSRLFLKRKKDVFERYVKMRL